jgi:nicotinamidase-related amidase
VRGQPVAELLRPDEKDYLVLKAKHSGFYQSQLQLLIDYLKVKTVIVTGYTTDNCVLFTASDAFMRDLEIIVPPDCVAAAKMEHHQRALEHMNRVLDVQTIESTDIDLAAIIESARK